jgi:hypothetical protein
MFLSVRLTGARDSATDVRALVVGFVKRNRENIFRAENHSTLSGCVEKAALF